MKVALLLFVAVLTFSCVDEPINRGGVSTGVGQGGGVGNNNASVTLRAVHLSPNAPNVDILVNDGRAAANLAYLGSTSFLNLGASNINAKVNVTGTSTTVINADLSLAGDHNTIVALNNVSSLEAIVMVDDRTAPAPGRAKVRVAHGVSVVGNVDVYVLPSSNNCTNLNFEIPTLSMVPFKGVSGHLDVPFGTYDLCVTLAGSSSPAIIGQDVFFASQSVSTVFAINGKNNFGVFGFLILDDLGVNSPFSTL